MRTTSHTANIGRERTFHVYKEAPEIRPGPPVAHTQYSPGVGVSSRASPSIWTESPGASRRRNLHQSHHPPEEAAPPTPQHPLLPHPPPQDVAARVEFESKT